MNQPTCTQCDVHACSGDPQTECENVANGIIEQVSTSSLAAPWTNAAGVTTPDGSSFNIFRMYLHLSGNAETVVSIYGVEANPMDIPAAHHVAHR